MVNTILAKRVNHIVAKGDNPVWPKGSKSRGFSTHHFSFGERFDETLMKGYCISCQYIRLSNHQFIGFSPLIKSAGKATKVNIAIRRLVGRTSVLPTDKGKPMSLAKRKSNQCPPTSPLTPPQAFGKQKAIAH